ncbi:MAG: aminomethyl transferase family protein [Armatimonadetes bacterium]|nr:aminomethyl transferase family protein [Armatimonadota bacterium]
MGVPTPFHNKTAPLVKSMRWKEWSGYFAPEKYDTVHDNEYVLYRQTAGLLDISPLFKYDVRGKDAAHFLDRVMAREVSRLKQGQVAYSTWCDERGKCIDDGTVSVLGENWYRVTSANPSLRWFKINAHGFDVQLEDTSQRIAALALQGPTSRKILQQVSSAPLDTLKFFHCVSDRVGGVPAVISRTGYTGDLGYEVWVEAKDAERLWDAIMEGGKHYGVGPAGLLALDMVRNEAGFILIDVDYKSAKHAFTDEQKSSPYEIGLGWTVHLDRPAGREYFVGREALEREKTLGSAWTLVGLEIDWDELEAAYDAQDLPPHVPTTAWRSAIPIFDPRGDRQVGYATSGTWSPILKKNIALATVETPYAALGTPLKMEHMIEFKQALLTARVTKKPFFDPPRKKSTIGTGKTAQRNGGSSTTATPQTART